MYFPTKIKNNDGTRKKRVYRRKKSKNKKNKVLPKFRELFVERLIEKCNTNKTTAIKIEKGVLKQIRNIYAKQ